ncbi:MAG: TonB-dependent receptor [Gammaproteobacteria bacterium]|nr:TonB-dependent receptor [Gammaproteobacteria bacterium]
MKKITCCLLLCAPLAHADEINLGSIMVEGTKISDVSGDEVKSADLAEALTKKVPSISLVRRSGIANDIILRGQKKDNINVLIDDAKIYGACPNRMDPVTSHILTNNIDSIEIIEGPYDVENFGTLSGAVKITTIEPEAGLSGEVSVNLGSWDYRKAAANISGGNETVKFLLSASTESSAQYEDGNGDTFAEQIERLNPPSMMPAMDPRYKTEYADIDAYEKSTLLGKIFANITDDQQLKFSYTANRTDDVLYPSSKMDALYDDSDIYNLDYTINNIGSLSKSLSFQVYDSQVQHPMSTFYRISSGPASANEVISYLETHTQGIKIMNSFNAGDSLEINLGLDASIRNWDGTYEGNGTRSGITGRKSIDDVDTQNSAVFAELNKKYDKTSIKAGVRYDDTSIKPGGTVGQPDNDYSYFSANVFTTFQASDSTKYFAGVGQASRVPDARELYFISSDNTVVGTPDLKETTNLELDMGIENRYDSFNIKTKVFHSWLTDYIYYNSTVPANRFENIDATIYGLDVSGAYYFNDEFSLDFGAAYQRGQKDQALAGQTSTNLAEIPPLKANLALNYDYGLKSTASIELVAADAWSDFDGDNGEQDISGYGVVNLKAKHALGKAMELTLGIDNIFDKAYAVSNTYKDLTLLFDGSGDVMLMNEPGTYYYANLAYKF